MWRRKGIPELYHLVNNLEPRLGGKQVRLPTKDPRYQK